jgi:hypothetical protein
MTNVSRKRRGIDGIRTEAESGPWDPPVGDAGLKLFAEMSAREQATWTTRGFCSSDYSTQPSSPSPSAATQPD